MAGKYQIGKYEFSTYGEYVRGMSDIKKIYKITHAVDIYDPDTALRIYQSIRQGKIKFYSKIGKRFFTDIADIVARSSKTILEEQESGGRRGRDKKRRSTHTDWGQKVLGVICLLAALACFGWYFWSDYTNHRGNRVNDYLRQLREAPQETVDMVSNDAFFGEDAPELAAAWEAALKTAENTEIGETDQIAETVIQPEVLPEYKAILQENSDFAGWIRIDGTKIDYPVMITRNDPDFYLNHNFEKSEDINGTLFMDARTNLTYRSANVIIYGHNMKSGQMFGGLKKYLNEDYWRSHKQIVFDTIYEKGTYEIFAVCLAQVHYQDEDTFRYYDFVEADTEETYQEFLQNISQLSVFMDGELPEYGEKLLTLSTCNNYVEDGRLFLVAKQCKDAE